MSQKLLDHSTDLQKLVEDGYELEIRGAFALVHHIPYVNQQAEVLYGTLVSPLSLSNNAAIKPETHVIYFIGEHPCDKNGDKLSCITHQDLTQDLATNSPSSTEIDTPSNAWTSLSPLPYILRKSFVSRIAITKTSKFFL